MSKEIKLPISKFVKINKTSGKLVEKYMIAEICCPEKVVKALGGGEYWDMVKIKITSFGHKPDNLVCLNSFSGGCPNNPKCILHVSDVY